MIKERQTMVSKFPRFDISNEAWREYIYPNGVTFKVEKPKTLILERNSTGDRHRLVTEYDNGEAGMYVKPGWLAIRWSTAKKKHGIKF